MTSSNTDAALSGGPWWRDYTVDAAIVDPRTDYDYVGIIARAISPTQYYLFELRPQIGTAVPYWYILKINGPSSNILASGPLNPPDTNPNIALRLALSGTGMTASVAFSGGTVYRALGTVSDATYSTGQVGIRTYNTTAPKFKSVSVTVTNSAIPTETSASSTSYADSIAMNGGMQNLSAQTYQTVRSLVGSLGVRHYRVEAWPFFSAGGKGATYLAELADLHASFGITFNINGDFLVSPTAMLQAVNSLPAGSVESVEGPNEPDTTGSGIDYDPTFAQDTGPYMQSLYAKIKSTPNASQIAVIGPSFANSASYGQVGSLSGSVDEGNMHDYLSGYNPGTTGYGASGFPWAPALFYGSIDWFKAASAQATGTKPIVATESGYCTAPVHLCGPPDVQAKYVPRLFLEQFRHGVVRTFLFDLADWNTTSGPGTLGLVNTSYVPKPAYYALAGMLSIFSDNGAGSLPTTVTLGLSGQTANVDHVLLHKADGTLLLPIWIEVPSYNVNTNGGIGAEISVPSQMVTITLSKSTGAVKIWICNPATGLWSSSSAPLVNGTLTVSVTDAVTVLQVAP